MIAAATEAAQIEPPILRPAIDPDRVEQDPTLPQAETTTPEQAELLGLTLVRPHWAVLSLCSRLGVPPSSLNLDLGPLGRLL